MTSPLLTVDELELNFGSLPVLRGLSFVVHPGEIVALVGPNGAGKTTVLNCINRVYHQQGGTIACLGQNLDRRRPEQVARMGVGRTMQSSTTFNSFTVEDVVLLGLHTRVRAGVLGYAFGIAQSRGLERDARRRCAEVLELVGIAEHRRSRVADLPYGVSKLADLARSLAPEPQLLLLDEPASGLSQPERVKMAAVLSSVHSSGRASMLVVEHDMSFVKRVASRIVVLHEGRKICDGPPDEALADPSVVEAFLGRAS